MFETVNENGVTLIDNNLILYFDEEDRGLIPRGERKKFVGANYTASSMHRKVKERELGRKPEVVNHLNHLEYDNRRCNLENCSYRENALDIYGRDGYSILRDCKWCQDLHLLYMTGAITEDEFIYLRLLRLSCFPNVVAENYHELRGSLGYFDLFDKYGITVLNKEQSFFKERKFFMSDPRREGEQGIYLLSSIFDFADNLKKNRLDAFGHYVDLSSEEQLTAVDDLILGEFTNALGFNGVSQDKFTNVLLGYIQVCNYRARLLYLVKRFYPKYSTKIVELLYTDYLNANKRDVIFNIESSVKKLYKFKRDYLSLKDIPFSYLLGDLFWDLDYLNRHCRFVVEAYLDEILKTNPNFKEDILDWYNSHDFKDVRHSFFEERNKLPEI